MVYLLESDLSNTLGQISVIMLGGAFGAAARYILTSTMTEKLGTSIPYGTLTVNVIGSFVMSDVKQFTPVQIDILSQLTVRS